MKVKIVKRGTVNSKPVAFCDFIVDEPPPMAKK